MAWFRRLLAAIVKRVYRIEITGLEHLRGERGRVIAVNHVSALDPLLVWALFGLDATFVLDRADAQRRSVRWLRRVADCFFVEPTNRMSVRSLLALVRSGRTVVVFPEGRVTVTGGLMKVYDSAGLLAHLSAADVIAVRIDGMELTPFSRLTEAQVKKRWLPKVRITILPPQRLTIDAGLKGKARRAAAAKALYLVMSDLIFRTSPTDQTLFASLRAAAARFGRARLAVRDSVGGSLTYGRLLVGAAVLGRKLAPLSIPGEAVGVLLPNAVGVSVTFWALQMTGRLPAMMNFTAGAANLTAACRTGTIKTILTSRAFVEKGKFEDLIAALEKVARIVWLEDVRESIGVRDKLLGLVGLATWRSQASSEDAAVLLFTSGSEGTPKGVVLSHRNVLANCAQVASRIDFGPQDLLFNVLPVFHSFGMTAGLVMPALYGVKLFLFPSPLLYKQIPEMIYKSNATILYGTDTFLMGYARAADTYDFRSVRLVVAGAEQVKNETRRIFSEKFGLRIYEGFGLTEASPVIAVNTPMYHKNGSVGLVLPGVTLRLDPVPGIAQGGRMWVKGPNVMKGYLRAEKPGVIEPPPDGWHDSGDIVELDAEGFLAIKGRAKRFAKIAGEMISLAAVENIVASLWPENMHCAVTVPDARKGERIVLLTDRPEAVRSDIVEHARRAGATELMVPAAIVSVAALPVLGSGKIDHVTAQRIVADRLSGDSRS